MKRNTLREQLAHINLTARRLMYIGQSGVKSFKGRNASFEFDRLRDYDLGDDIRYIDWKASARSQKLLMRMYQEQRQLHVLVIADLSTSGNFGTRQYMRETYIKEIASAVSLTASLQQHQVASIILGEKTHYVPYGQSATHGMRLAEFFLQEQHAEGFSLEKVLPMLLKNRTVIFLITDLFMPHYREFLLKFSPKAEIRIARVYDERELNVSLPVGIEIVDPETGKKISLDTQVISNKITQDAQRWRVEQAAWCAHHGIRTVDIPMNEEYIFSLAPIM